MTDTPNRDFRKERTNSLIEKLEQGVAPWMKPWNTSIRMRLRREKHGGVVVVKTATPA